MSDPVYVHELPVGHLVRYRAAILARPRRGALLRGYMRLARTRQGVWRVVHVQGYQSRPNCVQYICIEPQEVPPGVLLWEERPPNRWFHIRNFTREQLFYQGQATAWARWLATGRVDIEEGGRG